MSDYFFNMSDSDDLLNSLVQKPNLVAKILATKIGNLWA